MATILALPQEVLARVFDHVDKKNLPSIRLVCSDFETAGNPRFAKEFLTRRRHTMSLESISTMHEIVSHPYFGPFVRTIVFNCLRTADPHTPIDHDSVISSLPFQVDAEETIEETSAKYLKVVQIVQTIKKNHGRISIGVCLENAHKIQPCYGLGQLVSKGNLWPIKRMVYSVNHMKHNLKVLLHISKQADCPVSSIGVDLGSHTSEGYDQVTPWFFGPTLYQAIIQAIKGVHNEPVKISLNLKYGVDDSRHQTIFYDSVTQTLKKYRSQTILRRGALSFWLGSIPVSTLELDGSLAYNFHNLKSAHLGYHYTRLENVTFKNLHMKRARDWGSAMEYLSEAPLLKKEAAWQNLTDDDPRKYREDLGARITNQAEADGKRQNHNKTDGNVRNSTIQTTQVSSLEQAQVSSSNQAFEKLSLTSEKPLQDIKPSEVVTFKVPKHLRQDVLAILGQDEETYTATERRSCEESCVKTMASVETGALAGVQIHKDGKENGHSCQNLLSSRLQAEETAWNAPTDDVFPKYTNGFGAKTIHNPKRERNSKKMPHAPTYNVAVRHRVKRKSSITADEPNGYPIKNVSVVSRDVLHFTAGKQHFSKDHRENLYRNSEKPLLGSMALKVAKSQIPMRKSGDMLDIRKTGRAVCTAITPECKGVSYAGRGAAGNSTPVADQESFTGSVALVESAIEVRRPSNLYYATTTRATGSISSLEKALERLSLTSDKQPRMNKPSRIVTSKIPKALRQDVLKILSPSEFSPLATGIGHCKDTPVEAAVRGGTIAIANQNLSEGSVGVTEDTLRIRKHSTLLHSVLDNLSNETSLLFTQARSRYVLEEVQDVGDTDDWAKDLCTYINTISVSEEQEKPTTAVQSGSIMFMGAVRTEDAETDDWADEIGWDLDQVLKKHQEKA
ncbi:hypothetical protein D6D28_06044 [Aureobasidium pullulans]|uniref:F-box domain-containing protein n=1 Tax=Aureobasidium pullulans TaxID=5580 RepID=A0A4S8SFC1_AURPU|nr:hypothetical protein D6D28_06044 [Aureobasidium pullulans]